MLRCFLASLASAVCLIGSASSLVTLPNDTWSMGTPLLQLSISDLLQYQRTKMRAGDAYAPFRKVGMHRQRITQAFPGSDSLRIWTYRVSPNEAYQSITQIYFWDKHYYRSFAEQLQRLNFHLQTSSSQSNRLMFRNDQHSVWVDIIVWQDIYIMEIGR